MFRNATLAVQIAAAALTLGVSAPAAAQTPTYRAVPVTQLARADSVIIGDTLWACGPEGCTTSKATARPAIVCEQAVKKVGKLTSFSAGTKDFDADALAKCNARAKA
jgi:hypothetical protein